MGLIRGAICRTFLLGAAGSAFGLTVGGGIGWSADPVLPPILFPAAADSVPRAALPLILGSDPGTRPAAALRGLAPDGLTPAPVGQQPAVAPLPQPAEQLLAPTSVGASAPKPSRQAEPLPIDLANALRLANASNPTIALARERIREADARRQAAVLWVPNAWIGGNPEAPSFLPTFYHHDGAVQNAAGVVFDTSKSNFSLAAGASLQLSVADAIFAPRVARQAENAVAARARAVNDDVQLDVALAYLDLLRIYGALAINAETLAKAEQMLGFAELAIKNGLGKTTADANRARSEVEALKQERIDLEGDAGFASARLAQLLLLDPTADLVPADRAVEPIALVGTDGPLDELIAVGLMNRPELAESRSLVQAALLEWQSNKFRPLIPTLQVFYYNGSFQGGQPAFHDTGRRDDILAQASWELRNGGLGDLFRVREARSRWNQANLHVVEVQAQVAADVAGAAKRVIAGERSLRNAQESVRQAEEMWARLSRAGFGFAGRARQYDPLEALLAEQQLYRNRLRYLDEVISFNRNQFRLYWALGKPAMCALPESRKVPVQTPVVPPGYQSEEKLGMPLENIPPAQMKP